MSSNQNQVPTQNTQIELQQSSSVQIDQVESQQSVPTQMAPQQPVPIQYVQVAPQQPVPIQYVQVAPQQPTIVYEGGRTLFCPHDQKNVNTIPKRVPATKTHLFALLGCLLGGILCLWIPYHVDSLNDTEYTCPHCYQLLLKEEA